MKSNLNMINRFIFSINPKKYSFLLKEKMSKTLVYILIISIVIGSIKAIINMAFISELEKASNVVLNQDDMKFEMKNGILNFESSPIKEEYGQELFYIDTNKEIKDLESLRNITVHKENVIVFLKDGVMNKISNNEFVYKYSELGLNLIEFNNDLIISLMEKVNSIKYLIIPVIILIIFIQCIIYSLLISIMGLIGNLVTNITIKYKDIFKLSLYSMTLPMIISIIYPIERYYIMLGGFILLLGINWSNLFNNEKI